MTRRIIRRLLNRFRRDRRGVTAIETAFVAGPFLWLLFATLETGIMLLAEYAVENGTQDAARMIRTGQVQSQGITQAQFKQLVCNNIVTAMLDCQNRLHVDVRRFQTFASVNLPPPLMEGALTTAVTTNAQYTPGGPLEVVVVRTFYDWKLFTPGISKLANLGEDRRLLTATAAFRNEPYAVN
jgi:Flp pilus assembly protein TadG